jgi:predicted RNA binding protein YcfA (HicA-like mRNA interferase family)
MSAWPSTRARIVFKALLKIGWLVVSQRGSHIKLRQRDSKFPDYVWAFHDKEEIGPHNARPNCETYRLESR